MKQLDLAKGVGLSEQAISCYERGRTDPTTEIAGKISGMLGVAVHKIFPKYIKDIKGKKQ
jgi:DNA-binding XRE family transcriptional regulator